MSDEIKIAEADLADPADAAAMLTMMDAYMRDPMEGGVPMTAQVRRDLVPGLRAHPAGYIFFAWHGADPVGFAICFLGFSTFNARPLLNVHDIYVRSDLRGRGVGGLMLAEVERKAHALNCCRITLEVREDNLRARGLYRKVGFGRVEVGPKRVAMEFWHKIIA